MSGRSVNSIVTNQIPHMKHTPITINRHENFRDRVTGIFLLLILLLVSRLSYADVMTHFWGDSHRGYSVEHVPGTGDSITPAEYVAAGTVYSPGFTGQNGWHFMRVDATGNIITSRTVWANMPNSHSFRVVDIAVESATRYWITIQARNQVAGVEVD